MLSLRQFHKNNEGLWENLIKIDVVLIHNTTPRLSWSLARVTELLTGEDGVSRVARLKTASDETTRDINLLYPLETSILPSDEINYSEIGEVDSNSSTPIEAPSITSSVPIVVPSTTSSNPIVVPSTTSSGSKRLAAQKASAFLKDKIRKGLI